MTRTTKESAKRTVEKSTKGSKKAQDSEEKVVRRSAADFFQDNKAIAGFDNTMRVVFTSVRELVENGLDAAERIGKLPELHVKIEKLKKEEIAKLLNVSQFESSEKLDFLKLSIRDNGSGIQSEFVPPLFGRVLTGSNYGARQSRGRFGLGAKMVLLNAMSSVDLPLIIKSKHENEDFTSYHELMINLSENEPIILSRREIPQGTAEAIPETGTEVTVTFTGSWNLASRWVKEYFSQLSMITPYASIKVQYPETEILEVMERVVEEMPPYPQIAKVHPWGTDITQFKRELAVTRSNTMETFLQDHFQGIGPKTAKEFLEFVNIPIEKKPSNLSASDIRRIVHEGFVMPDSDPKKRRQQKYFPFRRPSGESLAPLGADLLAKGIDKELSPQFVRSATGDISAYSGHPFIIEAALAYGGPILTKEEGTKGGPKIYRFANRIPLLFGAGNDIITKCVQKMNWKAYKININKSPVAIVISVVSSKIPFPETSKEYIADVDELRKEISRVLKKLARGLSQHLGKAERERRERQRQSRFESAAPKVLQNLAKILETDETPFLLESSEEISKLEKSLASAVPRLIRRKYPPSPLISSIGEWLPMETYITLVESNIQTLYQFLRTPVTELSEITGLSEDRIIGIKRATVNSQERSNKSPAMREFEIFPKIVEDDYTKFRDSSKIHRALNKRWIVSSLDFFATPLSQLRVVENLPEKLIYEAKLIGISNYLVKIPVEQLSLKTMTWVTDDLEKSIKSADISNIFEYFVTFPEKLAVVPSLSIRLIENIKKEINDGIRQGYIDPEKVIGAATFEWMDYRVTPRLRGRKISKITEFMQTPTEKLAELTELVENLVLQSKKIQKGKFTHFNNLESLFEIPGYKEEMLPDLKRLGIEGFIDFLLEDESNLKIVRGLIPELLSMKQDEIIEEIEKNYEILPTKNAWWLDLELELQLKELGVSNVYDFIRYPTKKLLKINNLDPRILETIKRTYGTPIPILTLDEREKLESQNILCLEELETSLSLCKIKPESLNKNIQELLDLLKSSICYLPIPNKYFQKFHHLGISRIIDFLIWPDTDLHRKTGISYRLIEQIKSNINVESIKSAIDSKSLPIKILEPNLTEKSWNKLIESDFTLQELYYDLPYSTEKISKLELTDREFNKIQDIFNTPITLVPQIKSKWVSNLHTNGIDTFIDLITWSRDNIAEIIGRDLNFVNEILSSFPLFHSGMPLIDLGVFNATEINILKSKGYSTVENVYFGAKKNTFGVMGIKWKKIERFQRILETPIAMLQLHSSADKSEVRISHAGLERLADEGIDQIIKLVYWSAEDLKSILHMSLNRIEELKQSLAIKEHGMPLEKVCGYNKKTNSTLIGYGIETVEDLYFSASEDMLDEEDDLDWNYVRKAIEALDLPLSYLRGIISDKYVDKLIQKRIDSIIRFLITSEEELSQLLETPHENVANLRHKINLIRLRESTETSVSILEGLTRKQLQILADEDISTLFDFLTTTNEQLANILEIDIKQVTMMKEDLNFTNIKTMKEEKMVPLAKVALFDKRTVRKLARLGIESLADLYYVASPKTFEDSDIDWQEIINARTILDMPIQISSAPTKEEIKILHISKVNTVLDLMMESQEELETKTKLPSSRIKSIQDSININDTLLLLKRISIEKLNFPKDYSTKIHRAEIKTLFDLIINPNEEVYLKKKGEKRIRVDEERWEYLFSVLSIPLALVFRLDRENAKKFKQKRIETLRDAYSASKEKLETVIEKDPAEFLADLQALDFSEIYQFLQVPICFIQNIPLEWYPELLEKSITRVGSLLDTNPNDLAEILGVSAQKIRTLVNTITMPIIIKTMEEEMIQFEDFSTKLSEKSVLTLKDQNIQIIQELILHSRDEFDQKDIKELYDLFEAPINRLSSEFSLGELRKLSQNGVKSIANWLFAPNKSLADILGMNVEEITNLKSKFDYQEVSEITEIDTPLNTFIEAGYIDFDEIGKQGIRVLEDLLFIELEKIDIPDKIRTRLYNLKDALNSSIAYCSLIPPHYVIPLALNGLTSIAQLIKTDFSQINDPMGVIEEEDYNIARNSINLVDIITHKKTDSEFRVKLSTLRAFTPKQLEDIHKIGIDNIVDLYFRLDTEKISKSLVNPVESIKRLLEKPVALLPSVQKDFPQKIMLLDNAGITSIIEFLFWPKTELAELLEIKRYELSKYRKVNLGELKRKRNLGTPIENFVRIPEENIASLKEIGIDNIEDLYFNLKRYPEVVPDELVPKKLIRSCIKDLENPIVRLAGLPIPVAQELVKKEINRIIDFLYWPPEDLKGVYGLSAAKIKQIKNNVRIRRKSEALGRLEKYMTKD